MKTAPEEKRDTLPPSDDEEITSPGHTPGFLEWLRDARDADPRPDEPGELF